MQSENSQSMYRAEHGMRIQWYRNGAVYSDQLSAVVGAIAAEHKRALFALTESMGLEVLSYCDEAIGHSRDEHHLVRLAEVELRPAIVLGRTAADARVESRLHELAEKRAGDWPGIVKRVRPKRERSKGSDVRSAAWRSPQVVLGE